MIIFANDNEIITKGFTQMANIVFKLSDKDITTLMSRISFDTEFTSRYESTCKVSKYNCKYLPIR